MRRRGKRFPMPRFLELLAAHQPVGLVVGLPLALDGSDSESTRSARELAGLVQEKSGLPVELWDERLVEIGASIIDGRAQLVDHLRPHVADAYVAIAGPGHRADLELELTTRGSQPEDGAEGGGAVAGEIATGSAGSSTAASSTAASNTADEFRAALARVRRAELDRGLSLVGPHRDDLTLVLNDLPARGYASHGESWSFALSLKLASAALLRAESQLGDPVVVLDDVFAELDESRRTQLAAAIGGYEQVLITAAVLGDVPPELAGRTVRIRAGAIVEEES